MNWLTVTRCVVAVILVPIQGWTQASPPQPTAQVATSAPTAVPPDTTALLEEVQRNQKRLEALKQNYTYHVHAEQQQLDKHGEVKKTETEDSESLTINGVRVNRIVARNGKPLTPEEQRKESDRIDKEVEKAKERRARIQAKGGETDDRGDAILPLSRLLELGKFSNPRAEPQNGRPAIAVDYAGNPEAKTHSMFEGVMRDMVGTLWIDQADRVMVAAQGQFLNDFKLGGGVVADVRKGTSFSYKATRVSDGVWLPADITGQGSIRLMLFANFNGRTHVSTSDYKRFHTSATIVGSHGPIGPNGDPLPGSPGLDTSAEPKGSGASAKSIPQ